jgi:hypothetical protein
MTMNTHVLALLFSLTIVGVCGELQAAKSKTLPTWTALSNAIVLSPDHIYTASPDGHLQAHQQNTGEPVWRSNVIAVPIALAADTVIALGAASAPGKGQLLAFDALDGTLLQTLALDYPESVYAHPVPTPERHFTAHANNRSGMLTLFWHYEQHTMFKQQSDSTRQVHRAQSTPMVESGAFQLSFDSKRTFAAASSTREPPAPVAWELPSAKLGGRQFRAADDAHVLASTLKSDTQPAPSYQWSVRSANGAEPTRGLQLPFSFAPFVVRGERLLTHLPMYALRTGSDYRFFPERLAVYDLSSQRELYSIEVMNQRYVGAMPP